MTEAEASTGGFDLRHPPSRDLIADCVHCGFCLPSCPTYRLWGEEMDSPRGRIHLMQQVLDGAPLDASVRDHLDNCLGCMGCVTACPSGVKYDALIEAARGQLERNSRRTLRDRALRSLIFATFPHRRRLATLRGPLRAYQASGMAGAVRAGRLGRLLPPSLAAMHDLLPELGPMPAVPAVTAAIGERRARVGMLLGCVQREFFPDVNAASVRVLAAEGCEVVARGAQGCCGALSLHAGREEEALRRARRLIAAFDADQVDAIIINAAGCGSAMKDYGRLLADDPEWAERAAAFSARCRDISEWLDELGPVAVRHPLPVVAAYHDACHLAHAQGIRSAPRSLLAGVPDLTVREIPDGDICCGSAGIYNLVKPEPAGELGDRKATSVVATGAALLVTANPGCLMQIASALRRQGRSIALAHTVEVLDASIRGLGPDSLGV